MIIGIDEAGRGALAGPVVAGAVGFSQTLSAQNCEVFKLIKDSKKLSDAQRREAYDWLIHHVPFGVGIASSEQIDVLGIKPANEQAMNLALESLLQKNTKIDDIELQIDGRDKFKFPYPSEDIVKGDEKVLQISAASIIAKVTRDDLMIELDKQYPEFGFASHKGYGAAEHYSLLEQGIHCLQHRKSYDPLKTWLNQGRLF